MSNQQEPRLTFELAKLAKKAGFDWWTSKVFFENGESEDFENSNLVNDNVEYASPTHAQIMKWLRDVHEVYVEIIRQYDYIHFRCKNKQFLVIKRGWVISWEEAEAAGIKAALEYVIEKQTKTE